MGLVQKDAFRTMLISYIGIFLGYLNKGFLFLIILTTEQIGLINLLLTVGLLFAQFANLGNTFVTWKFLPFFKNEDKKHHGFLPLILLIVVIGSIVFTLLLIFFRDQIESVYITKSPMFIEYYYWVLPIGIGYLLFISLEAYLRGFYKNILTVFAYEIVLRLILTILLVFFAVKWISFDTLVITHSLLYLVPCAIALAYMQKINHLNISLSTIQISKRFRKILLQYSSFNYLNTLGFALVSSLDVMMIASMKGLKETGIYGTIVFLTSALQVPYRSLIRISAPLVADHWKYKEMDKMSELYTKVSSTSLLIGVGSFCFIWINIDLLFSFLSPEFQPGIWVFLFLMIGRLLDMYFGINGSIFSTSKKYKYDIIFTLILIGLVYQLNLIFIPKWGMIGAAISTSVALIFYNVGRIIFVWKIFKIHPFTKNQFIIISLALLTIFTSELVHLLIESQLVSFFIVCGIYLVLFIWPIYNYKLETETINFVKNGFQFLKSKLKRG